jgi:hypothetical protein
MAQYYNTCLSITAMPNVSDDGEAATEAVSEFEKHRETLLSDDAEEGWASELRRYLKMMQQDVKKDTNIVKWWQVSNFTHLKTFLFANSNGPKDNAHVYPMLTQMALDVLPSQASSVPCERLFSGTKQVATDHQASLGPVIFEEVTITKSAWGPGLGDIAAWNAAQIEEVRTLNFEQMLVDDGDQEEWDKSESMPSLDLNWL